MFKKMKKIMALSCMATMLVAGSSFAFAAENNSVSDDDINKYMISTSYGEMVEGEVQPAWLAPGPIARYPAEGGFWEYGFWNLKVRSYYTVNRCHGSTVTLGGKKSRSIDTAAGYTSKAELWAVQHDGDDRYYYRVCN